MKVFAKLLIVGSLFCGAQAFANPCVTDPAGDSSAETCGSDYYERRERYNAKSFDSDAVSLMGEELCQFYAGNTNCAVWEKVNRGDEGEDDGSKTASFQGWSNASWGSAYSTKWASKIQRWCHSTFDAGGVQEQCEASMSSNCRSQCCGYFDTTPNGFGGCNK